MPPLNNGLNVRPDIQQLIRGLGVGLAGDGTNLLRGYRLWHRLNVPKAGLTDYVFFSEARSPMYTNLDNPMQLPANYVFVVRALSFDFLPGIDRDGQRVGEAAPVTADVLASSLNLGTAAAAITDGVGTPWKWMEKSRELLSQGNVCLDVGERTMLEVYGLNALPPGRGVVTTVQSDTAMTNTAAAASIQHAYAQVTNGAPVAQNLSYLQSPIAIASGQQFKVRVRFNKPVDFTETNLGPLYNLASTVYAGTLLCELHGVLVSAVNN